MTPEEENRQFEKVMMRGNQIIAMTKNIIRLKEILKQKEKFRVTIWARGGPIDSRAFKERIESPEIQAVIRNEIKDTLEFSKRRRKELLLEVSPKNRKKALANSEEIARKEYWW